MIHWLVESASDLAEKPEWFLSRAEQAKYATFHAAKRREEWLLGRWTAKRLLQAALLQTTNELLALDALEIFNDADGAPFASCNALPAAWNLSLSHSHAHAFCAVSETRVGADLEFIEPRAENFVGDYFTANESARVNAASDAARAVLVTAIWSAKEAALKALHKGLSVDTRAVEISIAPLERAPEHWTPFAIAVRRDTFGRTAPPLRGWWRGWGAFVLTLAAESHAVLDAAEASPEMILVARAPAPQPHPSHRIGPVAHHSTHHADSAPIQA